MDHDADPAGDDAGRPLARSATRCPCGAHASLAAHRAELGEAFAPGDYVGEDAHIERGVEAAIFGALFPDAATRRGFVAAVGARTAMAAVAAAFPLATA
jgi:nitrate/nitrite transport system substrate-binding protein